jgi:NADPH-dependent ferric siderophore reductase
MQPIVRKSLTQGTEETHHGMSQSGSPIHVVNHPLAFRLLQVRRTTWLTPHMVRITLGGPALAGFRSDAADDGSRLYFPPTSADTAWVPSVDGTTLVFPEDQPRPPGREYTPRRYDPDAGELDFDFVVRGDGPASTWAKNAVPGDNLGVSGPRRSRLLAGDVDWYLLAGDETGLPAIARRLEELPAGARAITVVEVGEPADEQPMASAADFELMWVHRDGAAPGATDVLAQAVSRLTFPAGSVFAWAAGEASTIRAVRRHLLHERGIADTWMRMTGYWKSSVPNWDHHQPLD